MSEARSMNQWFGLLKWSLNYHDGTKAPTDFKPMSEDDKKWLAAAMKSHTVDVVERMKLAAQTLRVPDDTASLTQAIADAKLDPTTVKTAGDATPSDAAAAANASDPKSLQALTIQKKIDALEELDERVESIDHAIDFYKIGGFDPLISTLQNSARPELVWRAAQVFSTIVQNNPKCQAFAVEKKLLSSLLPLLQPPNTNTGASATASGSGSGSGGGSSASVGVDPSINEKIASKALLATSSLIRDCTPAFVEFITSGGVSALLPLIANASFAPGLRRKAVSLLRYALDTAPRTANESAALSAGAASADSKAQPVPTAAALKTAIVQAGLIPVLTGLIGTADVDLRTVSLATLLGLITGSDGGSAAALAVLRSSPVQEQTIAGFNARLKQFAAVPATDIDESRLAFTEVEWFSKIVRAAYHDVKAAANLTSAINTEYRRLAVIVAAADLADRKEQQKRSAAERSSVYATQAAGTHTNTDTPQPQPMLLTDGAAAAAPTAPAPARSGKSKANGGAKKKSKK